MGFFDLFKKGFLLETDDMYWFANHYINEDRDDTDPSISPFYSDNLNKMPSTIMVIAGFDPLRDGANEFSEKLKNKGVNVIDQVHSDQFHGFYHMLHPGHIAISFGWHTGNVSAVRVINPSTCTPFL